MPSTEPHSSSPLTPLGLTELESLARSSSDEHHPVDRWRSRLTGDELLLRTSLDDLAEEHRELIVLRSHLRWSWPRIARETGKDAAVVRARFPRAMAELRRVMVRRCTGGDPKADCGGYDPRR